ncbi:hypothetical protein TKK_0009482 [Trichogramma kaykai]
MHNLENQPVFLKNEHCHPRDSNLSLREKFERELKELACSPDEEDLKDIYDRVKLKPEYKPLIGEISFYTGFKEKMRAARSKYVPPIPRNLKKLGSMLEEYKPMKGLFRGSMRQGHAGQRPHHSLLKLITKRKVSIKSQGVIGFFNI